MRTREVDMLNGKITSAILMFALPLMISSILQLLFNAVDIIVVGKFVGQNSLAAVGSTGPLINLIINLFMGISIGSSVLMGNFLGANDYKTLRKLFIHPYYLL